MLFTTTTFVLFFTVFFLLYWFVFNRSVSLQNILILTGSYVFYAWADWRFLFLLIGSSVITYFLGIAIAKTQNQRSRNLFLWIGLIQGLGCLLFFKYFNFFITGFVSLLAKFNISTDIHTLNLLFPLGISFYTFRTIGYLLDIKRDKIKANTDWVIFFSYVSFFPCLISGPIDRPGTMIPQMEKRRVFDYNLAADGMRQILWGVFKKVVIADNCATFTNNVFNHYTTLPASALLFGAFMFTIQLYADFSGYSDMAIGLSSLLGIKITRNFDNPFFAQNIADFWRRWHISLTSWLTDYIFTPLSIYFRDYGKAGLFAAILVNFTAIGIWHGANWTFIVFGFLNGCYFIPLILRGHLHKKKNNNGKLRAMMNALATFILIMLTFVIFRSDSLQQAFDFYRRLFSTSFVSGFTITEKVNTITTLIAIAVLFWVEWLQRDKQHALQIDAIKRPVWRMLIYFGLIFFILSFSASTNRDFIYFNF